VWATISPKSGRKTGEHYRATAVDPA